jgi:hypothetical protein
MNSCNIEIADLTRAILKSDYLGSTLRSNPEVRTMLTSNPEKHIGSGFHALIFGSSIQKRTYFSESISKKSRQQEQKTA